MLVVRRSEGGFMEHLKKSAIPTLIGFLVPLVLIGCVFSWSTVRSIYEDHQDLVAQAQRLRAMPKPTCPSCPECLQKPCKGNALIESKNSLRRRTLLLVKELNEFWSHKPTPAQQPVQNASTDEDRQRNAVWDQYWRDAKAAYLDADYRHRLVGVVREYKNKGIDTGYMEQSFDQPDRLVGAAPFGGWQLDNCVQYMTELCQLRELAYHIDANDQPIFLVANSKEEAQ